MLSATLGVLLMAAPAAPAPPPPPARVLRVCADPNNLPFSNARLEGFDNRLAELLARELNATVEYTWWAQRRGFIRHTLSAGVCDVVLGVPVDLERVLTTQPYYRSSYAFVFRKDRGLKLNSLDDPALRTLKVGVHLLGDDFANTHPAHALARRGIVTNVVGYAVSSDSAQEGPPSALVEAVRTGAVDVAIAWGPLVGYFARQADPELVVVPLRPQRDPASGLPLAFDISLGVRQGDAKLKAELDAVLARRSREVRALLAEYGVPRP